MLTETTTGSVIMKISFTTMATPELPVSEQLKEAKRYGFDGVDLRMIERGMGEIPKNLTQEEANILRLQMQGLEVPVLMCYNEKIQSGKEGMETSLLFLQIREEITIFSNEIPFTHIKFSDTITL